MCSKYSALTFPLKRVGFESEKKVRNVSCVAKFVTENNRVFADLAGKEIV